MIGERNRSTNARHLTATASLMLTGCKNTYTSKASSWVNTHEAVRLTSALRVWERRSTTLQTTRRSGAGHRTRHCKDSGPDYSVLLRGPQYSTSGRKSHSSEDHPHLLLNGFEEGSSVLNCQLSGLRKIPASWSDSHCRRLPNGGRSTRRLPRNKQCWG